jgi:hypothetical protein
MSQTQTIPHVQPLTLYSAQEHLQRAHGFFGQAQGAAALDFTQADTSDKDGLLNFILVSEKMPSELEKVFDEQRRNLLSLAGVGTAFARRMAETKRDPALVYNTDLWQKIFNHFPLMGPSSFEEKTFHEETMGVEIATRFIETIFAATVSAGAALNSFRDFLKGQGDTIRAGIRSQDTGYRFGSITIVMETILQGEKQILVPKLKGYFINFTQSEKEWTAGCATAHKYLLDFRYRTSTAVFNYELLQQPDLKKLFDDFLLGRAKDDLKQSQNFFEGNDWEVGPGK